MNKWEKLEQEIIILFNRLVWVERKLEIIELGLRKEIQLREEVTLALSKIADDQEREYRRYLPKEE